MESDTLHDEVFGELAYDPPMEQWYADVPLTPTHTVEVSIWWSATDDGPFSPVLDRARVALVRFREREPEHRKALAAAMLERYRQSGRLLAELPGASSLARELTADQMWIAADGSATVHCDDDTELFGDHSVMADLDADGVFIGFTLQG